MKHLLPRRSFLQTAGLAAVSSLASTSPIGAHPASAPNQRPRLLPGCCAYSYRKYLQPGKMTMEDFFLRAVDLGLVGVDVTTYWLKSTEPDYLHGLRRFAYRHGLPFSGAAIRTEMCQSDPAKREAELGNIRKWVDAAELLGASHVRVFGGKVPDGATDAQGVEWAAETMKPACDYAAQKGIILGIESHHGITSKAANIIAILKRVDSPYAGCNLDISNWDDDPYPQIAALIPYATHTHIRPWWGEDRHIPLDLDRIWQMFVKGGYQGFMSVEYEDEEDEMTGVPKLVEQVKALCKKYSSV